jgi:hypothetical protein
MEKTGAITSAPTYDEQVAVLRARITDEIFFALGLSRSGVLRRAFGSLFYLPANRFGHVAAHFENETTRAGLSAGALSVMHDFSLSATTSGAENIPLAGPTLILSNHPGAYDSVVITSQIPRKDLTLVVSDVPFSRALTAARPHFVFVSTNITERMNALREMVHHLQNGGALLLFASGEVEPDPAFMPGSAETMATWSRSIEILLRKVPETQLVIEIASGVLLPRFVYNPITRLRKMWYHQQKLGELLQIFQQLLFPKSIGPIDIHISFSKPVRLAELGGGEVMPAVIQRARLALAEHVEWNKTFLPKT